MGILKDEVKLESLKFETAHIIMLMYVRGSIMIARVCSLHRKWAAV